MFIKLGPDALGRIVEQPVLDGNLIYLPHRPTRKQTNGAGQHIQRARRDRRDRRARRAGTIIAFPKLF
jgi:hypothetical protein